MILALALIVGIASWMPARFGPAYLALPEGPGVTVRICAVRCLVMTSTDAGPDLAMQRAGRVADIGVETWEWLCDCDRSLGLVRVSVEQWPTPAVARWRNETKLRLDESRCDVVGCMHQPKHRGGTT